jgi:adenylate kinase
MRLLLIGPPGAGKGSQAHGLAQRLGVPAISTGDLFRDHVARGTALGQRVQAIMLAGEYVPDSVTNELVRERLAEPDAASGFILDGYPRTSDQVVELDRVLAEQTVSLDAVIHLVVDAETIVARLARRAHEQGRADDHPDAVRTRLAVYATATEPIVAGYRDRGLVRDLDGEGSREEVAERLTAVLSRPEHAR